MTTHLAFATCTIHNNTALGPSFRGLRYFISVQNSSAFGHLTFNSQLSIYIFPVPLSTPHPQRGGCETSVPVGHVRNSLSSWELLDK